MQCKEDAILMAMNPYREIFEELNNAKIQYLVVGGVAVNLHGYSRFTGDVDILLALTIENLDRMAALMERLGYNPRLPVDVQTLAEEEQVRRWMEEKGMTAYSYIHPKMPQFSIDILTGDSFKFFDFDARKILLELQDLSVPVIAIDDLLEMKKQANRQKDIEDIAALLELKGL